MFLAIIVSGGLCGQLTISCAKNQLGSGGFEVFKSARYTWVGIGDDPEGFWLGCSSWVVVCKFYTTVMVFFVFGGKTKGGGGGA